MLSLFRTTDSIYNIAKQVIPEILVEEVHGSPTGVCCHIINNIPIILWDIDFWDYIEQNIFLRDTITYELNEDLKIITEFFYNYNGILFYHLSKRYSDFPKIQAAFVQHANEYNYSYYKEVYPKAIDVSVFREEYELEVMVSKLMALYHELAHLLFKREPDFKKDLENMVMTNVNEYISTYEEGFYETSTSNNPDRITQDYVKRILKEFISRDNKYSNLIEEMAADLYALSKTHATVFLNIEPSNSQAASDTILSGIMVYYYYISTYERVCKFWDSMIPLVFLNKKEAPNEITSSMIENEDYTIIRMQLYPMILFELAHKLDTEKWSSEDYSEFHERLVSILTKQTINEEWRWKAFESINNKDVFGKVLCTANQIDIENNKYSLDVIPKDALLITWISNQYHNCKGLKLLSDEDKPYEALQEFKKSIYISERYLGHYHRHTARAYNNAVTSLLELFKRLPENISILQEAEHYSNLALDILDETGQLDGDHSVQIFQNAGVVAQWTGDNKKAIDLYNKAKKQKLKITNGEYVYSIALTDSSLAAAYYNLGKINKATELCEKVMRNLEKEGMTDDELYYETYLLYNLCRSR